MEKKFKFLDSPAPFGVPKKNGSGALAFLGGLGALVGIGGSMMTSSGIADANADMFNNSIDHDWNVREYEHDLENKNYWERLKDMRQYYEERFNTEQKAVFDNWLKQNDPNTLLPKYAEAGYNMSAMTGASNMAMSPASTPVVTGQGSPTISPSNPTPPYQPTQQSQMIASIGGLIKDLASSSKDSAEVGELLSMLGPKVKNMMLQNDALSLTNEWTKARNAFKDKWWDQEFKNKVEEGNDLYWDAYFKAAQGELTDEKIFTEYLVQEDKYWDIQFDKAKTDEQQERVRQARIETQFWRQRMQAQIRLMGSQAANNFASANLSNMQAKGQQLQNIILDKDALIKSETVDATIDSIKEELNKNKALSEQQRKSAEVEIMHLDKLIKSYQDNPSLEKWERVVSYFNRNLPVLGSLLSLAGKL